MTIEERKHKLIGGLVTARAAVLEAVRAVPAERAGEVFLGTWSILDLLAHLVGWDFTHLQAVKEILSGRRPVFFQYVDEDWASYNKRLVETYRVDSLAQMLAALGDSHRQLVEYLESLSAREVVMGRVRSESGRSVSVAALLQDEARDEEMHAGQVRGYFSGT